jgi:hypothetical protein
MSKPEVPQDSLPSSLVGELRMRSGSLVLFALGLMALAENPVLAQRGRDRRGDQPAARHGWLGDLEQGKARARQSGKPLMVVLRCVP